MYIILLVIRVITNNFRIIVIENKTRQLLEDTLETLHLTESGAVLAANQVGILKHLDVIDYCGYIE